jgi:hypothetical protein
MKKEQLTKAFKELRKAGYFARQNYQCCQGCAWAEIPDEKSERAVFYHGQDKRKIDKYGDVYLAWSGDAEEIVGILKNNGLDVEWSGDENKRIRVIL